MITVRWFGGAAEAAGTEEETYPSGPLGEVLAAARDRHGPALSRVLPRCALLVDGVHAGDGDPVVPPGATLDVLPPFAGG
ncbi:MoaD/ThiS family protein [Janibacter alkaliphilus]|uniref:Molybdopterin converting factor small subunit n=1 Tax=Janibacter alkaliphilus TaxID=1069963 RepID=A0A852XD26_9MICO|nr:MoaD/ThiS family protein [Janibacter alkaliphilus]NYG38613.1 molybdopterin converting factor small subunit [Janibacter alkaliphilus]